MTEKTLSRRGWRRRFARLDATMKQFEEPTLFQLVILNALNTRRAWSDLKTPLPMYAGTASPHKVRKRRAKNKVAKASRKANR